MEIFRSLYKSLTNPIKSINVSIETIQYYATWAIKAKIFQVLRKEDRKRYLYLLSFIIHQYFSSQDTLIDILLTSVQNTVNTAIREHKEEYYMERKKNQKKVNDVIQIIDKKVFLSFNKIGDHKKVGAEIFIILKVCLLPLHLIMKTLNNELEQTLQSCYPKFRPTHEINDKVA